MSGKKKEAQQTNNYIQEVKSEIYVAQPKLYRSTRLFHQARYTFATTVTLTNGISIKSESKMLGHTKITTTQIYTKIVETKLSEDMLMLEQ